MPKAAFKEIDITRLIRAARKAGLPIKGVKVMPDGTISTISGPDLHEAYNQREAAMALTYERLANPPWSKSK